MSRSERSFEQVIEGWPHDNECGVIHRNGACDCHRAEALALRDRLVGLVREWREAADRGKQAASYADTLLSRETTHARVQIYDKCADALEREIGPLEKES